jgi:hypothetical protein
MFDLISASCHILKKIPKMRMLNQVEKKKDPESGRGKYEMIQYSDFKLKVYIVLTLNIKYNHSFNTILISSQ